MDYHIVEARYVTGHVVWLRFRDGTSGEIEPGAGFARPHLRTVAQSRSIQSVPDSPRVSHTGLAKWSRLCARVFTR